jgi:23S rRNA (pseudouridine1915-N3)-methyltransferase
MRLELIAFGKHMPSWVDAGFNQYASRLPRDWSLTLTELQMERRTSKADRIKIETREAQRMGKSIAANTRIIALAVEGVLWSTEQLAENLTRWSQDYRHAVFLVGGPEGLPTDSLQRAHERWSLSALTLPHALVRVVVAEQLYRGWSINQGLPYHRGAS